MDKKLPSPLAELFENEDIAFALVLSWLLGPALCALAGFYAGTIFGSAHIVDLQMHDMLNGGVGAGIGLAVGLLLAISISVFYPKVVRAEARVSAPERFSED